MKKLFTFSQRTRRIIIVLMVINLVALFSNYFEVSPRIGNTFILTDAGKWNIGWIGNWGSHPYSFNQFWPFTDYKAMGIFRGVFTDYDYVEFFAYTSLIFGIPIIRKLW